MNIAITGANGFIGRNIRKHFEQKGCNVYPLTRDNIDLLDIRKVKEFIAQKNIQVIFHTAITGGRRTRSDTFQDFYNNIRMFEVLEKSCSDAEILFNFGSGAEYSRYDEIFFKDEKDFGEKIPFDFYGFSKYLISKSIRSSKNRWVNLRIFNCFGLDEKKDRMITSSITKKLEGNKIVVHQNKYMDFFYIEDLLRVIDFYIDNIKNLESKPRELNLSYGREHSCTTLNEIAEYIDSRAVPKVGVSTLNNGYSKSYCGNNERLKSLGIDLMGIEKSIDFMFNTLKKEYDDVSLKSEEN